MKFFLSASALVAVLLSGFLVLVHGASNESDQERLAQYINLGKAFYENPTTQAEAVAEFKKALEISPNSIREQLNYGLALLRDAKTKEGTAILLKIEKSDPKLPHPWFNLGVIYKKDENFDEALAQFLQMEKLVPDEPVTHYNLGTLYKLQGNAALALKEFETARTLDPSLAAPHFQLYNAYRTAHRKEDADRELALFKERKQAQDGSATPESMEWCPYSEVYDPRPVKAVQSAPIELAFERQKLAGKVDAATAGLITFDADGDGRPDLLAFSKDGIQIYLQGTTLLKKSGLENIKDVVNVKVGDYNNDGLADLCILTKTAPLLYTNKKGRFEPAEFKLPDGAFRTALWIDFDHDYDSDLILFGDKTILLRNQGTAGFVEHEGAIPFQTGEVADVVAFRALADSKAKDILVSYRNHPGVLYQDRLTAHYEAEPIPALPGGASGLQVTDANNDGSFDIAFVQGGKAELLLNNAGKLESALPLGPAKNGILFADLANRGVEDLIAGTTIQQNQGLGKFGPSNLKDALPDSIGYVEADFDQDGKTDLAAIGVDGTLYRLINKTATQNHWVRVELRGEKNLKLAPASEVEIKTGSGYQKRIYEGLPLVFGTAEYTSVDTVRITWPNGLIQNEMKQPADKTYSYKEAQRLSGSCPLIFTWNGKEFEYITDVLGVAPLGAMSGDGKFFPTDHHEYIQFPENSLRPRDGQYDVRMTEELSEVSYFDQLQLLAVDRPADVEIFTNEKWKGPPFPEFRLFGVRKRIYPVSAINHRGHDELGKLLHKDKQYADDFAHDHRGVAENHWLTLDFRKNAARNNRAVLVLNGWVDWADGSTFLNQAQEGKGGLVTPYLQVKDEQGNWKTVIEDMGMPSGKPKTMAVDLTGKFLSASREVRIGTNVCVYWDEIFLGEESSAPEVRVSSLTPDHAEVQFRGFSPSHIHPERKQAEYFDYLNPTTTSYWNPTPGLYTRYGDVTELVQAPDDRMVIMGSGDELQLQFAERNLPALKPGQSRDFLLLVDGWAKDRDANTAYSQSVEPLPFHAMSQYPYPASEKYPDDTLHSEYRKKYNTRPALRLIRPLQTAGVN